MKKHGIFWIILDVFFGIEALVNVVAGTATAWDYGMLYCSGSLLVAIIVQQICREIQIQKKLKQMREEEKNRKNNDTCIINEAERVQGGMAVEERFDGGAD